MSETERYITIASLLNAAVFYLFTIIMFLYARHTRLNRALATQKAIWLFIILVVALPAYVVFIPQFPGKLRMLCWLGLSLSTEWVFYEVYRANWPGGWRALRERFWQRIRGK